MFYIDGPSSKWMGYFCIHGGFMGRQFTLHLILRSGLGGQVGYKEQPFDEKLTEKSFGLGPLALLCWT